MYLYTVFNYKNIIESIIYIYIYIFHGFVYVDTICVYVYIYIHTININGDTKLIHEPGIKLAFFGSCVVLAGLYHPFSKKMPEIHPGLIPSG